MLRSQIAGAGIGIVFGVVLSWSAMSDPDVVREALLFHRGYLFLFFAAAVATAMAGLQLVRRHQRRALLTDTPIQWRRERPDRRHIRGSLVFGLGWGVSAACPGPIATQLGQGVPWALATLGGVVLGVHLFLREQVAETEPASDTSSPGST
jgi:uncharacterized membrane protein YedE/YeeE